MKINVRSTLFAGLILVVFFYYSATKPAQTSLPAAQEQTKIAQVGIDLTVEEQRANALIQSIPIEEVLGSLAPIALSPFFALTCLSGASLMAEAGILPEGVANNFIMGTSSPLNNEDVFVGLLVLTLLTAAPKLTKVSKPFAQAVDQLEAYSGIVAAVAVQVLSRAGGDDVASQEIAMVYQAGFLTASYEAVVSGLLIAFSVINIFVVNTVKFFFEVMILISPFPTVDAIFESLNKAFTAFLVTVYLINPWAATVLNLLIFLFSLVIFAWTYRRVVFMRCALADPFFGWLGESVFQMRRMRVNSTRLPKPLRERFPDPSVVLKAFTNRKLEGLKKKTKGFLIHSDSGTYFVKPRWFRKDRVIELSAPGKQVDLRSGIFSHSIVFSNSAGEVEHKILFSKRYNRVLDDIHRELRSSATTDAGAGSGTSLRNKLRDADPSSLRSEFS